MKYLLTVLLLFASHCIYCQSKDSILTYTEVVNLEGQTKDQLFIKARQWFNDAWKSSKDVLQISDKETGELSGKGTITSYFDNKSMGISSKVPVSYHVSIFVFVKEGRYKYELTDFRPTENSDIAAVGTLTSSQTNPVKFSFASKKKSDEIYLNAKGHLEENVNALLTSLKNTMGVSKSKSDF